MNKNNIRFTSAVLSLALATGIALTTPNECFAEKKIKQGKFIEYITDDEGIYYNRYIVKSGDTLSRISEKICRFFNQEKSTEYWPSIAFLNGYPKVIRPGDVIVFPETFEELALLNANLKSTGWTTRYIQNNNIYKERKSIQETSIRDLLREIYGNDVCIDEDFVYKYLAAVGLADKYDAGSGSFSFNELFRLTDWIPTLEDLGVKTQKKANTK